MTAAKTPPASRLALARPAVRPAMRARMMISGASGSGKTFAALSVAEVLGGRVLVIDTEKESALTYADRFDFEHLRWMPPFAPHDLAATLRSSDEYDVVVVDSLSHFWRGQGGTLDIADGKFTGWAAARPAQEAMVEAVLECPSHVVLCVRAKQQHTQEQDSNGRHVVRKLGMGPIQDDTLDYELNVALELDQEHNATVSKSRTEVLPVGRTYRPDDLADLASTYAAWLAAGDPFASSVPVGKAKDELLAACGGDQARARELWGTRRAVTRGELDELCKAAG